MMDLRLGVFFVSNIWAHILVAAVGNVCRLNIESGGLEQVGGFCLAGLMVRISWRRLTNALLVFKTTPYPFVRMLIPVSRYEL
jgi:hypothetical protein